MLDTPSERSPGEVFHIVAVCLPPRYGAQDVLRLRTMLDKQMTAAAEKGRSIHYCLHLAERRGLELKFRMPPRIAKLELLDPDAFLEVNQPVLYIDIDNVIMKDLEAFFDFRPNEEMIFHTPWNPKTTGWLNAGVFRFLPRGPLAQHVWRYVTGEKAKTVDWGTKETRSCDDQRVLMEALDDVRDHVSFWPDGWVGSYKWSTGQTRGGQPARGDLDEAKILCFHGEPKPETVIKEKRKGWEKILKAVR